MKMVPRRVPGPPFWGPRGGLDLPFEALWIPSGSHLGPQCPPGRFWRISGVIWESILSPKSMKFGVDFRCVFGMLFGRVLEWCWNCFGWKYLFFIYVILVFSGVVGSIWGARKREKESANPIRIPTRFCDDFGIILGVVLGAKIVQTSMWILSVFFEVF